MPIRISIIGKTNTGKTTFFNAATLAGGEISTYPFTTKQAMKATGNATTSCVHTEFNVLDNPQNSKCVDDWRFIPIELIDLPGLIKDAWAGKGLGNQFLSIATQSDALIHIIDVSGSIDSEGRIAEIGTGDPISDYNDIEEELTMWYFRLLESNRDEISKRIRSKTEPVAIITDVFRGIGVKESHVKEALKTTGLEDKHFENFDMYDSKKFAAYLRKISKPTLIVANKIDVPGAEKNFDRLREQCIDSIIIPASTDSELTLCKAEQQGYIRYVRGAEEFVIPHKEALTKKQLEALDYITQAILGEHFTTGVQRAINTLVFKLLNMNAVYPVDNPDNLSDMQGHVLPNLILMKNGSTIVDLAKEIHLDLTKGLYAKDARYGVRLPSNYQLRDKDVVSVASTESNKKSY